MRVADRWCSAMLLLRRAVVAQVVLLAFLFLLGVVWKVLTTSTGVIGPSGLPVFFLEAVRKVLMIADLLLLPLLVGIAVASLGCVIATVVTAAMIDGAGYALRHLLLAVALLPVLLLGVLLVPLLVRSDGLKWGRLTGAGT